MFPPKFYKHFGKRMKLNLFSSGTLVDWDSETEHLKPAPIYMMGQVYLGIYGGFWFAAIHMIQMYLKSHQDELPEDGCNGVKPTDLRKFATLIIEGGEIMLDLCISFIALVFCFRYKIFIYLFNQLIDYNKKLSEMIKSGKLVLTDDQKNVIKLVTFLNYLVMSISTVLPFGIVMALQAEIEPTNQLFEEWLEIPFSFSSKLAPLCFVMMVGTFGTGTILALMMNVIAFYYMTALICTETILPEEFESTPKDGAGRCKITTGGFGEIADLEVIHLYRIQQILNIYLNAFFKSVLISFHHVGCLATSVVLLVFAIRYNTVIGEQGIVGYIVVVTCMLSPLAMIYFQCKMAGAVVDVSEDFKSMPDKMMPRKFLFRKFAKSCTTFYIQVTYPFYTVEKDTFTGFMEEAQGYSMELLLW